jgi:signal transduction histidine kinase
VVDTPSATRRLLRLVNQILDVAKLEARDGQLRARSIWLLVQGVAASRGRGTEGVGLSVETVESARR